MLGHGLSIILIGLFCGSFLYASNPLRAYDSTVAILIETVKKNNPELKAALFKTDAAKQNAKAAKSYDPPQLGVEFYQNPVSSFPNPIKNGMENDFFIQQMIPFPGKLTAMGNAENSKASMYAAERKSLEIALTTGVKSNFAELYLIWRKQEINAENLDLMRFHGDVARARYGSGQDMVADVLRAETEVATLLSDSLVLLQEQHSMEAMINASLGRASETQIDEVQSVVPNNVHFEYASLCSLALQYRPELEAMRSNINMHESERSAAKKEFLPDFMVKGTYKSMTNGPEDFWALMLGVTVPIAFWSYPKYSAQSEGKRLSLMEAHEELTNMRNMVFSQIRSSNARLESANGRIHLLSDKTVPISKQALDAALTAYKTGKSDFLMLVDDQKMYFMAKIDLEMAVMAYYQAMAQLEQSVGANPFLSLTGTQGVK